MRISYPADAACDVKLTFAIKTNDMLTKMILEVDLSKELQWFWNRSMGDTEHFFPGNSFSYKGSSKLLER